MKHWNSIAFYVSLVAVLVNVWGAFVARRVGTDPIPYLFWAVLMTVSAFTYYTLGRKA